MSYLHEVTVPRIDDQVLAALEAKTPGLTKLVNIPMIRTLDEAIKRTTESLNKSLPRYESVKDVAGIAVTANGWIITFGIWGD